jgi:hypothetical protein
VLTDECEDIVTEVGKTTQTITTPVIKYKTLGPVTIM